MLYRTRLYLVRISQLLQQFAANLHQTGHTWNVFNTQPQWQERLQRSQTQFSRSHIVQEAQLLQTDRVVLCVIEYFAKSLKEMTPLSRMCVQVPISIPL